MRKLYLLKRFDTIKHDELAEIVIRAETQKSARAFATLFAGDEGRAIWLDKTKTSCELLVAENGDSGCVIQDYRAG